MRSFTIYHQNNPYKCMGSIKVSANILGNSAGSFIRMHKMVLILFKEKEGVYSAVLFSTYILLLL